MKDSSQFVGIVYDMGVFVLLDDVVVVVMVVQQGLKWVVMCQQVIQVICEVGEKYVCELVEFVVMEIGMGCVEDKFVKNVVQVCGMLGVECLILQVFIGDNGLMLIENVFWGVVVLVMLFINLVVMVINNVISLIVVGNSVVFVFYLVVKKVL